MKKHFYLIVTGILGISVNIYSQTKIKDGTVTGAALPNANALLELESNNKGLLHVRLALVETTDPAPLQAHIAGIMVYNTAANKDVVPGIYYNDGTKWLRNITMEQAIQDLRLVGTSNHITADAGPGGNGTNAGKVGAAYNIAIGSKTLGSNNYGYGNIAIGSEESGAPLQKNTDGSWNIALGRALENNTTGTYNIALGYGSLGSNKTGKDQIGLGRGALGNFLGTVGSIGAAANIAIGHYPLYILESGKNNIAIGANAGLGHTSGDNNIFIGKEVQSRIPGGTTASNQLNIGDWIFGDNGNIGIHTYEIKPSSTLQVNGSVAASIRTVTGDATLTDTDYTIVFRGSDPATFTLPDPATCTGRIYYIINYGYSDIITSRAFANTTTGTTNMIQGNARCLLQSDGTVWIMLLR